MKLAALLALFATSCFAGDLYRHISLPLIDAYVDSSVDRDPDLPGMGEARHYVSVSLTTLDDAASAFGIYICVQFADGTEHATKVVISRANSGATPTTYKFFVGNAKPVRVEAFHVTRFHPESSDQLIQP